MNELMVAFEGGGWIYYKTSETDVYNALTQWEIAMEVAGVNIDNLIPINATLRDSNDSVLQEWII